MKILNKINFNLKETVNSESATLIMKNFGGQVLKTTGILIGTKDDLDSDTGEVKEIKVAILKTATGELISSISPTVVNSAETIVNAYTDANLLADFDAGVEIQVCSGKSGKGREFFFLQL